MLGPKEQKLTEVHISISKQMLATRLSQHPSTCYRVLAPLSTSHPYPKSLLPLGFPFFPPASLSCITQPFSPACSLGSLCPSGFLVLTLLILFAPWSSLLFLFRSPYPSWPHLSCWPHSVWTLPNVSGCSLPHVCDKNLLSHPLEPSWPHLHADCSNDFTGRRICRNCDH